MRVSAQLLVTGSAIFVTKLRNLESRECPVESLCPPQIPWGTGLVDPRACGDPTRLNASAAPPSHPRAQSAGGDPDPAFAQTLRAGGQSLAGPRAALRTQRLPIRGAVRSPGLANNNCTSWIARSSNPPSQ